MRPYLPILSPGLAHIEKPHLSKPDNNAGVELLRSFASEARDGVTIRVRHPIDLELYALPVGVIPLTDKLRVERIGLFTLSENSVGRGHRGRLASSKRDEKSSDSQDVRF